MFFIYVDESGSPAVDPVQHFFVLAAIVVKSDQCIPLQEKLQKLKQEYSLENIEIKGRDIEQAKKIFKHISSETRRGLVNRLFEFLFAHNISLFSVVFSKEEKSIRRLNMSSEDVYHYTYKRLVEHVEKFLASRNDDGLLLIDSRASSIRSNLKDDRLNFGQPFRAAASPEKAIFMPSIDETAFYSDEFIDSLFLHPDVNLPIVAKIIKRSGKIEKLP
jgi:hypothetical protein